MRRRRGLRAQMATWNAISREVARAAARSQQHERQHMEKAEFHSYQSNPPRPGQLGHQKSDERKATLIRLPGFGAKADKIHLCGRLFLHDWAQYTDVTGWIYREPRARTYYLGRNTPPKWAVILEGWEDLPTFPHAFERREGIDGVTCHASRYSSFAPEYKWEANAVINRFLQRNLTRLIYDGREDCSEGPTAVEA